MSEWGAPPNERVAWPFYVVCDVSESMWGLQTSTITPFEAMQEALLELADFPDDHIEVADIAHLGVLTFADDTQVVQPLSKMSDKFNVGKLPQGRYTNYARLFSTLTDVITTDLSRLENRKLHVKRPVVFIITDGKPVLNGWDQPRDQWEPALHRLHALGARRPEGQSRPIAVVALGFRQADSEILKTVAKSPGVACIAEAGVASPHELMKELLGSILESITATTAEGALDFQIPRGMTLCQ